MACVEVAAGVDIYAQKLPLRPTIELKDRQCNVFPGTYIYIQSSPGECGYYVSNIIVLKQLGNSLINAS